MNSQWKPLSGGVHPVDDGSGGERLPTKNVRGVTGDEIKSKK
jgi:hypothetical protein